LDEQAEVAVCIAIPGIEWALAQSHGVYHAGQDGLQGAGADGFTGMALASGVPLQMGRPGAMLFSAVGWASAHLDDVHCLELVG